MGNIQSSTEDLITDKSSIEKIKTQDEPKRRVAKHTGNEELENLSEKGNQTYEKLQGEVFSIKKPKKAFKGIPNLGNTCFMNSVLQSLAHTSDFMKSLDNENKITKALFDSLKSISNEDNTKKKIKRFIREISKFNPIWKDKNPHDCKEFLVFLLNILNKKQVNVFLWEFKKRLKIGCGMHQEKIIETKYFFTIYSLSKEAITNCLIEKVKINEFEGYLCSSCQKEYDCKEMIKIVRRPKRLILYIDPNKSRPIKLRKILNIYQGDYSLELYSLILTLEMGIRHFVTICKENSNWMIYDDERVSPLKSKVIEGIYMLFYKVK